MPINNVIKEKRKEKGYTQEQVAEYLGVSTPAVNKWERGISFPDISLLSPLARLLDTDLNTLLCFEMELSEKEIHLLCNEVIEEIKKNGYESGFAKGMRYIQEYPNCGALIQTVATTLEGSLIMFATDELYRNQEMYDKKITGLYEWAAKVGEGEVKSRASFMLASKYMKKEEYGKAREILSALPERTAIDKRQIEAQILTLEKRYKEALELLERRLLEQVTEVQQTLWGMLDIEIKQGNSENAGYLSDLCAKFVRLFELWDYNAFVGPLEIALYSKDAEKSIQALEDMLNAVSSAWEPGGTFLYRHHAKKILDKAGEECAENTDGGKKAGQQMMVQAFLSMLENDPSCGFLRGNDKFEEILVKFRQNIV